MSLNQSARRPPHILSNRSAIGSDHTGARRLDESSSPPGSPQTISTRGRLGSGPRG